MAFRKTAATFVAVKHVGVVGMGLMGHGIAQLSAMNGFKVTAVDIDKAQLEKGMKMIQDSLAGGLKKEVAKGKLTEAQAKDQVAKVMGAITPSSDVAAVHQCDLIVEAIVENLDIKKKFFGDLGKNAKKDAIFGSNTSSFPITQLSEASGRGDKLIGLHFFNPVQVMQLVEIIRTTQTSDDTFKSTMDWAKAIKKEAVTCGDTPGFIVNRLLVPYLGQALLMLERGVASFPDIDVAMMAGAAMPMGPFVLADYVGLDTCLSILEGWNKRFPNEPAFQIPATLGKLVKAGKLGRKSGSGFYNWTGDKPTGPAKNL
jgi:3-hydroxyacyl-CoA dehydrogenase